MFKLTSAKLAVICSLVMTASASAFAGGWAVIVYNPTTHSFGSSRGANDRADAEAAALSFCGQNCEGTDVYSLENGNSGLVETFTYNGWVSLAVGTGAAGTSGLHDSQYDAEQSALNNCAATAPDCRIVRTVSAFDF